MVEPCKAEKYFIYIFMFYMQWNIRSYALLKDDGQDKYVLSVLICAFKIILKSLPLHCGD
jgi:hypothetical protein